MRLLLGAGALILAAAPLCANTVCKASASLLDEGPLHIRVKLDQVAQPDQWAMKEALKYWSTILDMDWTADNNPATCNLELVYAKDSSGRIAFTIMPHVDGFDGTIHLNTGERTTPATLVTILVHEFGHLMGLCHTRDRRSAMYYRAETGVTDCDRLSPHDIVEVGKIHRLKG